MPRRFVTRKKTFKRKMKRPFKRLGGKKRSKGELMVNRSDPKRHTVIAERYATQMFIELMFELTSSVLPATQYYDVGGMTLDIPFSQVGGTYGNDVSTLTGYALLGGTTTADLLCPNGYGDLAGLYNQYLVRASRITVNITPSNQTTALAYPVRICVFPWGKHNLATVPPTTIEAAQTMPYAKMITVTPTNNIRYNTIVNYVTHHKLLGVTRQQFENDQASIYNVGQNYSGGLANNSVQWRVIYQVYASGTTVYTLSCSTAVKYYTEWMAPELSYGIVA